MNYNNNEIIKHIQSLVDLETECWNKQNIIPFLNMIHPDMVWPFPPTDRDHDPTTWVFIMGRFNFERWKSMYDEIFSNHYLSHNIRKTLNIKVSKEEDAALAVVDIDTLWIENKTGKPFHWKGRVCKIYTKMTDNKWLFYSQTGALDYSFIKQE
ncbi:hypothetical protein PPL_10751 [Heterostelium album PN500]|uniref:SnoaL-like domain-containing protein n=1 Tax=Heterostelium pallidum (strain ATCC 26659 / Pp 5 / PN500) TaxID=670386 RepID=D3BSC5_HETP5|nr:hypothetical protein PPL_10751 [Heterostelium album PN500]EFA75698.1 hypothetical protein PPL_10751 [Heterostelium album PN500]|eukprot:XP_020427832.1 hypothetical protein PPL_10751 [Heterostelium album PN500]